MNSLYSSCFAQYWFLKPPLPDILTYTHKSTTKLSVECPATVQHHYKEDLVTVSGIKIHFLRNKSKCC